MVMGVGAAVGAVIGGGSSLLGISKSNKSLVRQFKEQMKSVQQNYNYNENQLSKEEKGAYDETLSELFLLKLNAMQNNASVNNAIAETGVEGRTVGKLQSTIQGAVDRQVTAKKDAYNTKVWNIRSQKEALYIQTKHQVEQARNALEGQLVSGSKAFSQVAQGAAQGAAIGAMTAGAGASAMGVGASGATGMSFTSAFNSYIPYMNMIGQMGSAFGAQSPQFTTLQTVAQKQGG